MPKNQVKIYYVTEDSLTFSADWSSPRQCVHNYFTELYGEEAAEEAFHIFNAPPSLLNQEQRYIRNHFRGRSLSVGDVVEVLNPDGTCGIRFLCDSFGWKSRPFLAQKEAA